MEKERISETPLILRTDRPSARTSTWLRVHKPTGPRSPTCSPCNRILRYPPSNDPYRPLQESSLTTFVMPRMHDKTHLTPVRVPHQTPRHYLQGFFGFFMQSLLLSKASGAHNKRTTCTRPDSDAGVLSNRIRILRYDSSFPALRTGSVHSRPRRKFSTGVTAVLRPTSSDFTIKVQASRTSSGV